jgi:hypothetical protein
MLGAGVNVVGIRVERTGVGKFVGEVRLELGAEVVKVGAGVNVVGIRVERIGVGKTVGEVVLELKADGAPVAVADGLGVVWSANRQTQPQLDWMA